MSATTITKLSDEMVANAYPAYSPLKPNQLHGRVRTANFRLTLASEASGTSFGVARIPKGARILGGEIAASATLANSATLSVGLAAVDGTGLIDDGTIRQPDGVAATGTAESDQVACLKAAAAQGTTQVPFAITQALGYLYETGKEVYLTLTTGTGTVATEVVTGSIRYVLD